MIRQVEYEEFLKPAMQLAFGKTLICRNQDVCSQFSKSHDIDTITLEGLFYCTLLLRHECLLRLERL